MARSSSYSAGGAAASTSSSGGTARGPRGPKGSTALGPVDSRLRRRSMALYTRYSVLGSVVLGSMG
jgi:hypothetical protein